MLPFVGAACIPKSNPSPLPGDTPTPHIVAPTALTPYVVTTRLTALAIGELTTVDNCLRVEDYLLVWPPEFVVNVEGDTVQIEDKLLGEKTVWRLGEVVQVGGGEVSFLGLTEDVRASIPANCQGAYWLVGGWLTPTATVQPR